MSNEELKDIILETYNTTVKDNKEDVTFLIDVISSACGMIYNRLLKSNVITEKDIEDDTKLLNELFTDLTNKYTKKYSKENNND